jgi:hypothetical protein
LAAIAYFRLAATSTVGRGDSEKNVLSLGPPSEQHLDGLGKTIEYRDFAIKVLLTKGRAYSITIKEPQDKATLFWRFIRNNYRHG